MVSFGDLRYTTAEYGNRTLCRSLLLWWHASLPLCHDPLNRASVQYSMVQHIIPASYSRSQKPSPTAYRHEYEWLFTWTTWTFDCTTCLHVIPDHTDALQFVCWIGVSKTGSSTHSREADRSHRGAPTRSHRRPAAPLHSDVASSADQTIT